MNAKKKGTGPETAIRMFQITFISSATGKKWQQFLCQSKWSSIFESRHFQQTGFLGLYRHRKENPEK